MLYIYIYKNLVIELYTYIRNYTYTYKIELWQQVFIYSEEAPCTSHTSCTQVLQLQQSYQSHFGNNQEGTLFSVITI